MARRKWRANCQEVSCRRCRCRCQAYFVFVFIVFRFFFGAAGNLSNAATTTAQHVAAILVLSLAYKQTLRCADVAVAVAVASLSLEWIIVKFDWQPKRQCEWEGEGSNSWTTTTCGRCQQFYFVFFYGYRAETHIVRVCVCVWILVIRSNSIWAKPNARLTHNEKIVLVILAACSFILYRLSLATTIYLFMYKYFIYICLYIY